MYELLVYLISMDSRPLTLPQSALSVEEISIGGVSYSTSTSTKFRDSNVIFSSPASDDSSSRAGSVEVIFRYTYSSAANQEISEYFLAIREYLPMDGSDGLVDIYRTFGFAGRYLCLGLGTINRQYGFTVRYGRYPHPSRQHPRTPWVRYGSWYGLHPYPPSIIRPSTALDG